MIYDSIVPNQQKVMNMHLVTEYDQKITKYYKRWSDYGNNWIKQFYPYSLNRGRTWQQSLPDRSGFCVALLLRFESAAPVLFCDYAQEIHIVSKNTATSRKFSSVTPLWSRTRKRPWCDIWVDRTTIWADPRRRSTETRWESKRLYSVLFLRSSRNVERVTGSVTMGFGIVRGNRNNTDEWRTSDHNLMT